MPYSIILYFIHSTSVLLFYIDVVLTLSIHTCVCVTRDVTSALPVGPLHWARLRSVTATPDPGRPQPRALVCVEIMIIANIYIQKKCGNYDNC